MNWKTERLRVTCNKAKNFKSFTNYDVYIWLSKFNVRVKWMPKSLDQKTFCKRISLNEEEYEMITCHLKKRQNMNIVII